MIANKAAIVESAKLAILDGNLTLQQIADSHGIARRTLQYWLAQLGEEYEVLRRAWIDALLVDAGEELEKVGIDDPLEGTLPRKGYLDRENLRLARARELWRKATWYAERRDPVRYSPKQEVLGGAQVVVVIQREIPPKALDVPSIEVVNKETT